jgi:hypothetical protein
MKTKTIKLPDSGRDVVIKELTYGQSFGIAQKSLEYKEGTWTQNPIVARNLMLNESIDIKRADLEQLSVSDTNFIFSELDKLAEESDLKGKSQEQSQSEKPATGQ